MRRQWGFHDGRADEGYPLVILISLTACGGNKDAASKPFEPTEVAQPPAPGPEEICSHGLELLEKEFTSKQWPDFDKEEAMTMCVEKHRKLQAKLGEGFAQYADCIMSISEIAAFDQCDDKTPSERIPRSKTDEARQFVRKIYDGARAYYMDPGVAAVGDLDCDGVYSTFEMHGVINAEYSDGPSGNSELIRVRELE